MWVSLQIRLLAAFTLLIVLAAGFLAYFHVRSSHYLMGAIGEDLQSIGTAVRLSSRTLDSDKGADRKALEEFVREAAAQKYVREVHVVGSNRKIVASSDPDQIGRHMNVTGKEIVVREELGSRDSSTDSSAGRLRYQVRVPILRDGKVIGMVQTSVLLRDFRALVRATLIRNLAVSLAALLLAFFASSYFLHLLSKPLRTLTTAAEKVAAGDLSTRLPVSKGSGNEVSRLNIAFNAMTEKLTERRELEDKLRDLDRQAMVNEMSASLAHEIRNPLNLINLTAGHLDDAYMPADPARRTEYGEIMRSLRAEVQHLNEVAHRFLAMGQPGRLNPERFRIGALMEETKLLIRQHLVTKQAEVQVQADPMLTMRADKGQLRLLLLNLFLNAAEASPMRGTITASAFREGAWMVIRVGDEGGGIAEADRERIFQPYQTGKATGIGLGLALVRRISEEHQGTVRAGNGTEGGALFEVRIPDKEG